MRKFLILLGFLLLVCVDTFVQFGFKKAGTGCAEPSLDWSWIECVVNEPWSAAVLCGYGAAFLIYMTLLKHAPVGPAFAASHMEIVTVTLISVLYFGDQISALQAIGCCAIVAGVIVLAATEQPHE